MTRVCSRNLTQRPAFGGDDNAFPTCGLRIKVRRFWWVTLSEHKWVILGERRGAQGRRTEALAEYQVYKRILEGLSALDPANTDWQRELSVSHGNVGSVYQAQGRRAEALAEYQACKRIREGLTALDPANTDWQRDLSVSHTNVGRVYQEQGRLAEALAEYQADLAIAERLALLDPTNAGWQTDLSITRELVDALRRSVEPKQAEG